MIQIALPLDWTGPGRGHGLIEADANREALDLLTRPDLWPSHCVLLVGPRRSGRSRLATAIASAGLAKVIDDARAMDETSLFHQWNVAREAGHRLLLVTDAAPPEWTPALPDLCSRIAAAGVARIGPPDEVLIAELITRGLTEAGSWFAADLPRYLAARLPRDYGAVAEAIAALNRHSLATGTKISVQAAKSCLNLGEQDKSA